MKRTLDDLDKLYLRNLVRGIKLRTAVRDLKKKRTSTSTKQH